MYKDVSADTRPDLQAIRHVSLVGVVLHTSNGIDSLRWLQSTSALSGHKASSDFLLSRNGDTYRIVRRGYYSFHAGNSQIGRYRNAEVNEHFLGIELENYDEINEVPTEAQYQALGALLTELLKQGELPSYYYLTTHAACAIPLGRRHDPWGLDINRVIWPAHL